MKRVSLYRLHTADKAAIAALEATVESFNELGGIKATFHPADEALDAELPEHKSHSHCLFVIASSRDSLKAFIQSDAHRVTFAQQLLDAGCNAKEVAVHDGPLTAVHC